MINYNFIGKFNKDKMKQVFFKLLLFGFGFSIGVFTTSKNESTQSTQLVDASIVSQSEDEKTIPELIADQIRSGDLNCQELSPLRYEGCLLFQGTLGVWKTLGMPKNCPIIGAEGEESQSQKILPEDAMRATESPCFGYLYAINVANVVPVLINTPNFAFYELTGFGNNQPGSDAEQCMAVRRGICGNQTAVAISLFDMAGIIARPIEFYFSKDGQRNSHITVEAEIDGEYRLVDTTYGAYWLNSISGQSFELMTTDLLIDTNGAIPPVWNNTLLPYSVYQLYGNYDWFEYLKYAPDIIRGGMGEIKIKIDDGSAEEDFKDIPNFIGDNQYDSNLEGISFVFTGNKELIVDLRIAVKTSGVFANDSVELCVDQSCQMYSVEKDIYYFSVLNPETLYLNTSMDVAYLVLEKIWWNSNSSP